MEEIFTDDSFYYFYSTVPQVLAGGIALVGVFLIFFITESNKKMLKILKDTWSYIDDPYTPDHSEIKNCMRKEFEKRDFTIPLIMDKIEYIEKKYYPEIFAIMDKCSNDNQVINQNYKQFKFEFNLKSNAIKNGIWAVILSGILMATSILLLPLVQGLINCLPLGIFITVLVIGFSSYAIYLIANVVIRAIRKL